MAIVKILPWHSSEEIEENNINVITAMAARVATRCRL
jgi:hypothetical protein